MGSKVNLKVRQKDLKFKYLQEVAAHGFEKWKEEEKESYPFPLTMAIVQEMEKALGTSFPAGLPDKGIDEDQTLLHLLPRSTPPVTTVSIEKFRITYRAQLADENVLVELADIKSIEIDSMKTSESFTSVGLEGQDLKAVQHTRDVLGLPGSLQIKGYLQLVEEIVERYLPR